MDKLKITYVILEYGFLSNSDEEKLKADSYQSKLTRGIYRNTEIFYGGIEWTKKKNIWN